MDALIILKEEHRIIGSAFVAWDHAAERLSKGKQISPRFVDEFVDFLTIFVENYHYAREEALFKSLITLNPQVNPHCLDFDEWVKLHGSSYSGVVHLLLDYHEEGHNLFAKVQDAVRSSLDEQAIPEGLVSAINTHNKSRLYEFSGEEQNLFPEFEKRVLAYNLDLEEMRKSMDKVVANTDIKVMERVFRKHYYTMSKLLESSLGKKDFWNSL